MADVANVQQHTIGKSWTPPVVGSNPTPGAQHGIFLFFICVRSLTLLNRTGCKEYIIIIIMFVNDNAITIWLYQKCA